MILKNKIVFVGDFWDGQLAGELKEMSSGLTILTSEPGYHRTTLDDYVCKYEPIVAIISIPTWQTFRDAPAVQYYSARKVPLLYVVNKNFCQKPIDPNQLDFFTPRHDQILFRNEITGLSLVSAIYDAVN